MTEGAEGTVIAVFGKLRQGTIAVYLIFLTTISDGYRVAIDIRLPVLKMLAHPPLVRPYHVWATGVVHTVTSINDKQLVDETVAVPVVEAPVDVTGLQHLHDILHQILRVLVEIIACILHSIAFHLNILQVKGEIKVAITLVIEIVVHRALEGRLRQVPGIEDLVPLR